MTCSSPPFEGEQMIRPFAGKLALAAGLAITIPFLTSAASASSSPAPAVIPDSALQATSTTVGGATPQPSTSTVSHFFRTAFNPLDATTFGFNMVGQDPALRRSTTITVDVTPLNVTVGGRTFNGTDILQPTLHSPVFTSNHLLLNPVLHPAISVNVPSGQGTLIQTARGVVAGDVASMWWATQIQNLNNSLGYADPTHLQLYLTDNVMLFGGRNPLACCIIGFHGASEVPGHGLGSTHGTGSQPIQTFAWASYTTPGFFNPQRAWAIQDIDPLSHEISEWADDPFINNSVQPWTSPAIAPNCSNALETGDPVVGVGFAKETNTFRQGPTPNGTQVADGFYHPEDEALLPWFMRLNPSPAQTAQSGTNGRYTFMGDLNPFPVFHAPPPGCPA